MKAISRLNRREWVERRVQPRETQGGFELAGCVSSPNNAADRYKATVCMCFPAVDLKAKMCTKGRDHSLMLTIQIPA
jgi:hypothetical protein